MGGKTKQTQRTKNNSRPSNSGRSAELFGSTLPTFVGFSSSLTHCTGDDVPILPGFTTSMAAAAAATGTVITDEEFDANLSTNLDSNFQLVLRKMTKKDPITKVKALKEFRELVKSSDMEMITLVLPFWPRLYQILSTDVEHQVREASHQAQAILSEKCGKKIAPYLRQLAPAWITGQYDTYAPAATIATTSFESAFRPNKQQEVFNFCQNEILDFFIKNLTVITPASLNNSKSYTAEECESKYQRIVTCSLKGYAQYLSKMSNEILKEATEKNHLLIDNPKFWSFHKSKTANVRAAWFETLTAILRYAPYFVDKHLQQVTSNTFQTLDESEIIVLPYVWSSIILVTKTIDNWKEFINIEKALLPKLWKVIKCGGGGNASVIFPNLHFLLTKLNRDTIGDDKLEQFYTNFLANMKIGLMARASQPSRMDITAIATAYYECLQYITNQLQKSFSLSIDVQQQSDESAPIQEENTITTTTTNENPIINYYIKLVDDNLISVIEWCISNDGNCGKFIFPQIASYINYCQQNISLNEDTKILEYFFNSVYGVMKKSLEQPDRIKHVVDMHFEFVQSIQRSSHHAVNRTKNMKVQFGIEQDKSDLGAIKNSTVKNNNENMVEFNKFACRLCKMYIKKTTSTVCPLYINNLQSLFKCFGGEEFFDCLAKYVIGENNTKTISGSSASENILQLNDYLSKWLFIDELQIENIVDIILQTYPYLNSTNKFQLLTKLIKFTDTKILTWVIDRLLSHPLCTEPHIDKLLADPLIDQVIINQAKQVSSEFGDENFCLLHKCFFLNESGKMLISAETCTKIIECIARGFNEEAPSTDALKCVSFLAQIMPGICSDDSKKDLQRFLFVHFFEYSINMSLNDEIFVHSFDVVGDILWEVKTTWQDALSSNDVQLDHDLLRTCSAKINQRFKNPALTVEHSEHLSEMVSKLIHCSIETIDNDLEKYDRADTIIDTIFNEDLKSYRENIKQIESLCLFLESLNGNLTVLDLKSAENINNDQGFSLDLLFKYALFKFNVIFKITCSAAEKKKNPQDGGALLPATLPGENNDDENTEDFYDIEENILKKISYTILDEIVDGVYIASLGNSLMNYSSILTDDQQNFILNLSERVILYLRSLPRHHLTAVIDQLFTLAADRGQFWSVSLQFLMSVEPYNDKENGWRNFIDDSIARLEDKMYYKSNYINTVQTIAMKMTELKHILPLSRNIFPTGDDINDLVKAVTFRCFIHNYHSADRNKISDIQIYMNSMELLKNLYAKSKIDKQYFLYNVDIIKRRTEDIIVMTELANFYAELIRCAPNAITYWDLIRIAISSWVLTVSKSSDSFQETKVAVFFAAIYNLFSEMTKFIALEKTKSSTEALTTMIEEWDHLFDKDVNLILLKCYLKFISHQNTTKTHYYFIEKISKDIHNINLNYVIAANRIDSKTSMDDLITFAIGNLDHACHSVRVACVSILKKLSKHLIAKDLTIIAKETNDLSDVVVDPANAKQPPVPVWHVMQKFEKLISRYQKLISDNNNDMKYSFSKLKEFPDIPANLSIPYLLLWDCIFDICSKSLAELRSAYVSYLSENNFIQTMLVNLFLFMPHSLLKDPDSKFIGLPYFEPLKLYEIMDDNLCPKRFACHMYVQALCHLPAVTRKWWTDTSPAQKTLIDKITTNYVSKILCQNELQNCISGDVQKVENMQIYVHASTREVRATYSIDETFMELIISLPINYPLGSVKVTSGKQIGDKLQTRTLVMQLTIFLMHQNGSILDGLSLWKRNLDRKFEGVQECYICYAVIHQDTCQLPKLTCRKCKNRFHGPCLYKWFSTSNKSTCPICRNIF